MRSSARASTSPQPVTPSILGPVPATRPPPCPLSSITNTAFVYGDFSHYVIGEKVGGTRLNYVPNLFGGAGRPTGLAGLMLYTRVGAEPVTTTASVVSSNPGL